MDALTGVSSVQVTEISGVISPPSGGKLPPHMINMEDQKVIILMLSGCFVFGTNLAFVDCQTLNNQALRIRRYHHGGALRQYI
jgi:hypothetical protein